MNNCVVHKPSIATHLEGKLESVTLNTYYKYQVRREWSITDDVMLRGRDPQEVCVVEPGSLGH